MRTVQLVSLEALDLSQTKHVLHSQEVEMFLGQVEVSQDHEEMEYLEVVLLLDLVEASLEIYSDREVLEISMLMVELARINQVEYRQVSLSQQKK